MKTVDYAALPHFPAPPSGEGGGETKWVVPEKFLDVFPSVLDDVHPLPGEEAIYANSRQLMNAAHADPAIAKLLTETAVASEHELVQPFFASHHNGRPAGNNWNRSTHNAEFGVDYFDRLGTARSNMFDNRPNERSIFTPILMRRATGFRARTATRLLFPKARRRRSRASGRSPSIQTSTSSTPIR